MNVLVFGAGVIGTVYAARLQAGGNSVTILARGERLHEIRSQGLALEDLADGHRSTIRVATIEQLHPGDSYHVALITVRREQLKDVMPALMSNHNIPTLVFMLNNPLGAADLVDALGKDRVILGFPGAGGSRQDGVVHYAMISQQPTTLGEFDGNRTARLLNLAQMFRASQIPTRIERHMDAWLKAHAFFITAVSGAIYLSGGDCRRLSEDKATLKLMVKGVSEGFAAVRQLGLPVTPFPLKMLFSWAPQTFAVAYWRRSFSRKTADYIFGRHARSASGEMLELAKDCRLMLEKSGAGAGALRRLYHAIDDYASKH